ncbi:MULTISPECIES: signal peptidase II [unclassified Curtobacterium]|uniref:signal peptidase II n=1 Tax=unclassified Curtobacterium TaxID=257496 RepID=UPI002436DF53|nr:MULTISPECIES: signal peptidase II [unclassified Curtobacterium]
MSRPASRAKVSVRAIAALAFAAVVVVAFDQVAKALVVANLPYGTPVPILGGALQFLYVRNPGAAFSFAVNMTWVFSIISAAVVVAIIIYSRRIRSMWWAVVLGMLLGGALGNLIDRLFREPGFGRGHVVDFISTPWMMPAIYNVADSFICISMVVFVLLVILGVNLDGSRTVSAKRGAAQADTTEPLDGGAAFSSADAAVDEPTRASRPNDGDRRDALGHDAT